MVTNAELIAVIKARNEADKALKEVQNALAGVGLEADGAGSKFAALGKAAAAGAAIMAGSAVAAGVGLFKLGQSFDDAYDTIAVGTGATGDALDALEGDFKKVFTSVPTDMGKAAQAIADLNTRTGASGEVLQGLSATMLEMTRLTGGNLTANIASVTRLMGDWGIAAEDGSATMDKLFVASQATGIGIDTLARQMVQFGAPLRQLGFGFETSAALLAKFEKEGVNAELVMGSLRIALGKMARDGEPAEATLQRTIEAIKNAGSTSEANALALELFGARAGPDMAAAIREGRFAVDDLVAMMEDSEGAIMATAESTADFGEKWTLFKNKALTAIEPIATKVLDLVTRGMGALLAWFDQHGPKITAFFTERVQPSVAALAGIVTGTLVPAFSRIATAAIPVLQQVGGVLLKIFQDTWRSVVQPAIAGLKRAFDGVAPVVATLAGHATTLASALADRLLPPLQAVVRFVSDNKEIIGIFAGALLLAVPVVYAIAAAHAAQATAATAAGVATGVAMLPILAISAAIAAVAVGIYLLIKHWDDITAKFPALGAAADGVKAALQAFSGWVTDTLVPAVVGAFDGIKGVLDGFVGWVTDTLVPAAVAAFDGIKAAIQAVIDFVGEHWGTIQAVIEPVFAAIQVIAESTFKAIETVVDTTIGVVSGLFQVAKGIFTGDWGAIKDGVMEIVTSLKDGVVGIFTNLFDLIKDLAPIAAGAALDLAGAIGRGLEAGVKLGINAFIGLIEGGINVALDGIAKGVGAMKAVLDAIPGPNPLGNTLQNAIDNLHRGISIPRLARGTTSFRGGLAIVGEAGPELVAMPRGSRVYPAGETRQMLAGAGMHVTVNINAVDAKSVERLFREQAPALVGAIEREWRRRA